MSNDQRRNESPHNSSGPEFSSKQKDAPEPGREPVDDRPAGVRAMDLATRVLSACLTPVVPPAAGFWMDGVLGTAPWLLILGLLFGLVSGYYLFRSLLQFISREEAE